MKNVLACVQIGSNQITKAWEYLEGSPSPFLVVLRLDDTNKTPLVIKMKKTSLKPIEADPMAEITHLGTLDISEAYILKQG